MVYCYLDGNGFAGVESTYSICGFWYVKNTSRAEQLQQGPAGLQKKCSAFPTMRDSMARRSVLVGSTQAISHRR